MEPAGEAGQNLAKLESQVNALRDQLARLEAERDGLIKAAQEREQIVGSENGEAPHGRKRVINWKWIQEATKFFGVSVFKCGPRFCTFHFHPMHGNVCLETYSMTVNFNGDDEYTVGQCFLPESINEADLDSTKPLDRLVWDISNLVDCFAGRKQQIEQLETSFGESGDRTVTYSLDRQRICLRVKVSDYEGSGGSGAGSEKGRDFMININLTYNADEILPHEVQFELEDRGELDQADAEDFETHCMPFYQRPLFEAFREAF